MTWLKSVIGVEFLDTNSVKVAKTLLWHPYPLHEDCPIRKGNNAPVSHFSDTITLLKPLDKTDNDVPTFVIKRPMEAPCLPATAYTSLFSKFNEVHQVVLGMSSKLNNYKVSIPQLPRPASVLDSHATVIVSKEPDALSDPLYRKAAID